MLDVSALVLSQFRSSYTTRLRVTSWLDDESLGDVPASSGSLDIDRSMSVPETISFSVPRLDRGVSYDPIGNDHPLSTYGQQVNVQLGVGVVDDVEWLNLGWYLLTESSADGDTISVQASGLLKLIDEARFLAPFQPTGTFTDTVQSLIEPAITVVFDPALVDRNTPISMQWDEDRLGALGEVLDAWPAEAEVTEDGFLYVHTPIDYSTGTTVWDFTEDPDTGTVTQWQGSTTRDGAFNCVVARGEDPNGQQIQGVVYDTDPTSSTRYGGDFSPLPVPFMYYSPLLTTLAQCRLAANTIMARKRRQASRKLSINTIPNPALRPGDIVTVTSLEKGLDNTRATLESFSLPLNPGGGDERIEVWIAA